MNLNQAVQAVRELLLNPMEQEPSIKLVFGSVLREMQNFYNELANSSVPWTTAETAISVTGDQTDYQVSAASPGRILFVTSDIAGYPVAVEFTDLGDASRNFWEETTMLSVSPGDAVAGSSAMRVAFYRRNGLLYCRVPQNLLMASTLTITYATGNWTENVAVTTSPVLTEYEHLAHIRAALNVLPAARWSDANDHNDRMYSRLEVHLPRQMATVYEQFVLAKRSLTADDVVFIETNDDWF